MPLKMIILQLITHPSQQRLPVVTLTAVSLNHGSCVNRNRAAQRFKCEVKCRSVSEGSVSLWASSAAGVSLELKVGQYMADHFSSTWVHLSSQQPFPGQSHLWEHLYHAHGCMPVLRDAWGICIRYDVAIPEKDSFIIYCPSSLR